MEYESGVTQSIIDEFPSSYLQGDQMESQSSLTRSFIDELHSCDIQRGQMEGERMVLLEVSLMNSFLGIFKDIK